MDKNNDALAAAYGLVLESKDSTTVGNLKVGQTFDGADKKAKDETTKNVKLDKPVAGPSQGDSTVADGKGKPLKKAEKKVEENKGIPTTFDKLYASVLNEEEGLGDIAPSTDIEDSSFDEDTGDFPEGELEDEEGLGEEGAEGFDAVAAFSELAAAIQGIADKLAGSSPMGEEGLGEEDEFGAEGGEEGTEEDFGAEPTAETPFKESASIGKIPAPTTPKVAKKTSFNPKMTKTPKNSIGKSGAGKAGLPAGKDRSGTLSKAPATKFGPKMSQTVGGAGPIAKGGNESLIK
jgi:hypothetical protein